jgi:prolyl-tRNA editing enzyme YbaK/EbsC (Cys-tRNA(Pro) deacylase)
VTLGSLTTVPALSRPELLAPPVQRLLSAWEHGDEVSVAEIDPALADTAALTHAYGVALSVSANCVVVGGRRAGAERIAACVVLATTRADVNGLVKQRLDVRKASFLPMDRAVELTAMEYGGITPVGLPADWALLVDAAVAVAPVVIVGSGVRRSKLVLPGALVGRLPGAEVVSALGIGQGQPGVNATAEGATPDR